MLALALLLVTLPPAQERVVVKEARALLGVPYELGGRMRTAGDGIDCQGLVFFALQPVAACGWRSWSVMPTVSIAEKQLGAPVPGLSPVATADLDPRALRPGDVVHFVGSTENTAEPALTTLADRPVWVWHMGLAAGDGRFVVGDHFAGAVVEEDLAAYLRAHADVYAGIYVTRMDVGPRVDDARCRRHPPMRAPSTSRRPTSTAAPSSATTSSP